MAINWSETSRLGTELEVVADFDLTPLFDQFQPHVSVLRNSVDDGRHTLWLELIETETDLDDAVQRYVAMVDALPSNERSLWDKCIDRCLNTGIQSGTTPHAYPVRLSADSIARAARISVRHQFTVYAAHSDDLSAGTTVIGNKP